MKLTVDYDVKKDVEKMRKAEFAPRVRDASSVQVYRGLCYDAAQMSYKSWVWARKKLEKVRVEEDVR